MTLDDALTQLRAHADPARAAGLAEYHKAPRAYLGLSTPQITDLTQNWRAAMDVPARVALADALWQSDIFEARIAAAKLLTQARIKPDDAAWALIASWVPTCDSWAIADAAAMAGQKRLVADPARIETVAEWTRSPHHWTRRAAMVFTLPWTKQNHPKPEDLAIRQRVLEWAAAYVHDPDWFIQKSVAWWLRELSKHDPARVSYFLANHAKHMKPFARREAAKYLQADHPAAQSVPPAEE
ncbi:MAG: DNA alkylation repair protein [Rhodobacterales bacterium]